METTADNLTGMFAKEKPSWYAYCKTRQNPEIEKNGPYLYRFQAIFESWAMFIDAKMELQTDVKVWVDNGDDIL